MAKKPGDVASALATSFVDSFNPVGGNESILNLISPTIVDPIVDIARNRDYADRPIMPEQNQYGPQMPDSQRYWGSVSMVSKALTDTLNTVSGGDAVRPGAIDVSPEVLDHMMGVALGAAGTFYGRSLDSILKVTDPTEKITINDIPLVRKIVGGKPSWYNKAAFYDRAGRIEQLRDDIKEYSDRGQKDKAQALQTEHHDILRLYHAARSTKKKLKAIRERRDTLHDQYKNRSLAKATFTEQVNRLREVEQQTIVRFNRLYIAEGDGHK